MSDTASTPAPENRKDDTTAPVVKRVLVRSMTRKQAEEKGWLADWEHLHNPPPPPKPKPLTGWRKVVSVALSWLFVLSIIGLFGFGVYIRFKPEPSDRDDITERVEAFREVLALDDVLHWQQIYGDLVGRNQAEATARFGSPTWQNDEFLEWKASDKTFGRHLWLHFSDSTIRSIEIVPKRTEMFSNFSEITQRGGFSFDASPYYQPGDTYYGITTKSADGHCEMKFTLHTVMFLESVKFQ